MDDERCPTGAPAAQVGFHGLDMSYVVDEGPLEILVGPSSRDAVPIGRVNLVPAADGTQPAKAFDGPAILVGDSDG